MGIAILILLVITTHAHAGSAQSVPVEPAQTGVKPPMAHPIPIKPPDGHNTTGTTINNAPSFNPVIAPSINPVFTIHNQGGMFSPSNFVNASAQSASEAYAKTSAYLQSTATAAYQRINAAVPDQYKKNIPRVTAHLWTYARYYLLGATYAGFCIALIAGNHYLSNSQRWSRWKQEHSLTELCALTQKELAHDLIVEIQRRYINPQKPTDFLAPLIAFMNDIDIEVARTTWYARCTRCVSWWPISYLFPLNYGHLQHAGAALERLHFIKHIFISWMGEYNIHAAHQAPKVVVT